MSAALLGCRSDFFGLRNGAHPGHYPCATFHQTTHAALAGTANTTRRKGISSAADRPLLTPTYMLIPEPINQTGRKANAPRAVPAAPPSACAIPRQRPSEAKPPMV